MNLEESIQKAVEEKLKDGSIEKIISDKVEKGISEVFDSLFNRNGDCKKVIEEKVKSVMVPYLESIDYSSYIVKLDEVLTTVVNSTLGDNKKILSNFKELMSINSYCEVVKVSDIFAKWCEYVSNNVNTDNLEVDYDDEPHYESVEVNYEFEQTEKRDWLKREKARILFVCEHDEEMNICIDIYRYDIHKENQWDFEMQGDIQLTSLKYIDEFKLHLMALKQASVNIEIDETYNSDYITPEKEPEAYFG